MREDSVVQAGWDVGTEDEVAELGREEQDKPSCCKSDGQSSLAEDGRAHSPEPGPVLRAFQ